MPIEPNLIERTIFLRLNQGPGVTFDLWSGIAFRVVAAAIRLNVFHELSNAPVSIDGLAKKLGAQPEGLGILLDNLLSLGYVKKRGEQYHNTAMTTKWLTAKGAMDFSPYYLFWDSVLRRLWHNLEESILTGQAPVNLYEWIENEPEVSRYFQEGMIALAQYSADEIASKLDVPAEAKRFIDIGGGHGTYSIALCQKHPQLSGVIFDSPQALNTGRPTIEAAGMAQRIAPQEGNFMTDALGEGYDLALVFNIVHGFSPEDNVAMFERVKQTLNPGGKIVIVEQLDGGAPLPLFKTITNLLSMAYFHVLDGRVYAYEDIAGWLEKAGFRDVEKKTLMKSGSGLITATR